ncbi:MULTISPECIES: disulfide bond formation protein B [unclassified Wenzhouxiangella]|uniref:disulfide bond formation protein B n=1 Tax=unclassified Wenzhouxiangella TaxID=2613841 RepID=UPI000E32D106|nr:MULTISPECIES: disulfide bond formation protein B [unclassified Wenzhouxiangella]RFF27551.1 disulfide bond formation protein B [Wenzhouxiangella sp. 15181]RFP69587.1 disulfide bond formation protein B [Wenzhouxiangella sp. 15190]
MKNLIRGRTPFVLVFAVCAVLLAFAYYAQFVLELEPCPLCILQRLGFMIMGGFALLGAIHGPTAWGRWVYGVPILAGAAWGITTAARHIWLQNLPADQVPDCGPGMYFMLEYDFPLMEILREAFTGAGECAEVAWQFLGLSMPMWTLIWYVGLAVFTLWALLANKPGSRTQEQ